MDKPSEQRNLRWLRQYAYLGQRWLFLAVIAGSANAVFIVMQAWLLAALLHGLIIEQQPLSDFTTNIVVLFLLTPARALTVWAKERLGFKAGAVIRRHLREQMLQKFASLGPAYIQQRAAGSWTSMMFEQVEKVNDYYSRYIVQMRLVMIIPITIIMMILPTNWAAVAIFVTTAPLTIMFMALVGMGAADANKRNFVALSRLSGHFLDRLKGIATLRQYQRLEAEGEKMDHAADLFRQRTMEVLRMAFMSSAVLEFFASVSIALIAVYFGFSYLGELDFGHYDRGISLFSGLLVLFLAPEFFQPFRDLGTYYHAKAEAVGAADSIQQFLQTAEPDKRSLLQPEFDGKITIEAHDVVVKALDQTPLTNPLSFRVDAQSTLAIGGQTGCGKTSLMQAIMGVLPYDGSLTINGTEVHAIDPHWIMKEITWLGQSPLLIAASIADNLRLAAPEATDEQLWQALNRSHAAPFVSELPQQLNYVLDDNGAGLSVGQIQRIALARTMLKPTSLLLMDEPTASLDQHSEQLVAQSLVHFSRGRTVITISHRATQLTQADNTVIMTPREDA
ncbi:heme ABC transporter permease/ATP-binding protein CydD [Ferrimonas lipolytica]|uniref:Cysteine/glutathione ABC transporter permease/ATP-binding protein CydD n=1 Tax=Ferrimonas lipolytica TaxID=2724191 RepID=A0A6H1UC86_9GAMM|nr:cysteine/glutathione ABC transporter permease/ATP-binding protein CydD [Ferrimonas lipolytica]QIZ76654.1 cysteine/glutathione ABC transporter permease/ATP-binding protein CydD [Ferrimonas lipolytica]